LKTVQTVVIQIVAVYPLVTTGYLTPHASLSFIFRTPVIYYFRC